MTTAHEIADWHRAEAKRLKGIPVRADSVYVQHKKRGELGGYSSCEPAFDLTARITLHERFAAWLEKV